MFDNNWFNFLSLCQWCGLVAVPDLFWFSRLVILVVDVYLFGFYPLKQDILFLLVRILLPHQCLSLFVRRSQSATCCACWTVSFSANFPVILYNLKLSAWALVSLVACNDNVF